MIVRASRRDVLRYGSAAAVAAALPAPAIGQGAWPNKPIRIVCGFPAGGLTDTFARVYGEYISQKTGQPVTVENKTGAGGAIGFGMLALTEIGALAIALRDLRRLEGGGHAA